MVVGLVLLGIASMPEVSAGPAHGPVASADFARSMPSASPSFAARAGFVAGHAAETIGARPAARPQSVDVVFQPQNGSAGATFGGGSVPAAEYARSHGLTPAEYAAAEGYFVGEGVRVVHAWPDRLVLSLEGTPAALDRAFGTVLLAGTFDDRSVVFPSVAPTLPSGIETEVAGVVGLSSGFETFSLALTAPRLLPASPGSSTVPASGGSVIDPGMARTLYNLTELYNLTGGATYPTSEAIALILWGAGYDPSDISTFYSDDYPASFPTPKWNAYPIDGASEPSSSAPLSKDSLAVEELTLDLEWSGSMAPGATLDAVYAPGPSTKNLTDAFEEALSLPNMTAISMSFGGPEVQSASLAAAWTPLFSEAADRGITVLAATGDTGGDLNSSCTGGPAPEFPASSPQVLAVGGTAMTIERNGLGMITGYSEAAWGDGGGGLSADYRAPNWQLVGTARTAIEFAGGGRGTPDVSATAVNNFIFYKNQNQAADGTSFATPLWAGVVADLDAHIGHALGFFTPRLYHVVANQSNQSIHPAYAGVFDIQKGFNCVAQAGVGWDAATGWGTPRGAALEAELAGSFVNLTLIESPSTVAPGESLAVRVQVANWSSGAPMVGTPVDLRVKGDSSVGPCTGTFDSTTILSNSTGWVSANLGVSACYLGAHAIVSASVLTDRLFGQSSVRIAVNLLGLIPQLESLGNAPLSYVLYTAIMASAVVAGAWLGRPRPPAPGSVPAARPPSPVPSGAAPAPPVPAAPPAKPPPASTR
ncbi:MAG: S8 family serine peptidase [Thermoplasmata archaeon]